MEWILSEKDAQGASLVSVPFTGIKAELLPFLGEKLETPFGPAAGPHAQLAQNYTRLRRGGTFL